MPNINHSIVVNAPVSDVYNTVATVEGLKKWWTIHVEGESQEEQKLVFGFPEKGPVMEVLELMSGELVKWKCVEGVEDWTETIITFEFEEKNGKTEVLFAHSGWKTESVFFAHCNTKWAVYMLSLKKACETGEGQPFPDDIKIEE